QLSAHALPFLFCSPLLPPPPPTSTLFPYTTLFRSIIVPQGIRLSASFQDMTPILGVNIIANANKMIEDESIGCNIFSVDQSINKMIDMPISRHSLEVIGPIAFNCC